MKKISVLVILVCMMTDIQSQIYSIDFGTDTGMIRCTTPYVNTTLYCSNTTAVPHQNYCNANLISSNRYQGTYFPGKCQFDLKNPGDTSIGRGSELQFLGDDFADLRFQASNFVCTEAFKISFKIKIPTPSPLHWSYPSIMFYFGDKASQYFDLNKTPNFYSSPYPYDTLVFGSINFRSGGALANYCNALDVAYGPSEFTIAEYYSSIPRTIIQGVPHTIEVFANTSFSPLEYLSPEGNIEVLPGRHFDIYADSVRVHHSFMNLCYRGGDISAFSWYMNQPNYHAPIIIDDIEWSSDFALSLLPVELSRFEVFSCDGNRARACLEWRTEMEITNNYFVVERSIDALSFVSIDTVLGAGTTTMPQEYSYEDATVSKGNYYYRLKQVDFDGQFDYSATRSVLIEHVSESCNVGNILHTDADYILYDMTGREVKGRNQIAQLDLRKGMYVISILGENGEVCRKKIWIE
jgi:hypothetical protein